MISTAGTITCELLLDTGYFVDESMVAFPCLVIVVVSRTKRMNTVQEFVEYFVII